MWYFHDVINSYVSPEGVLINLLVVEVPAIVSMYLISHLISYCLGVNKFSCEGLPFTSFKLINKC